MSRLEGGFHRTLDSFQCAHKDDTHVYYALPLLYIQLQLDVRSQKHGIDRNK